MITLRAILLEGEAVARAAGEDPQRLFLEETLASENARRLVTRSLRRKHPELSFESISGSVEDALGFGTDRRHDMDPIGVE